MIKQLVVLGSLLFATGSNAVMAAPGDAEAALTAANKQWEAAFRTCDRDALARLTSDDLVFIHAPGATDTKTTMLAGCGQGLLRAGEFWIEASQTSLLGADGGMIVGLLHMKKEPTTPATLRITHVFRRERGTWRLVMHQTSRLPSPATN